MSKELNLENIEEVLSRIRPHLQVDGGDVEVVSIDNDSIVKVRLLGACNTCPLNLMTLRAGIERTLMLEFPEIVRIESVA
ncbi:MAG: NifU family protein [Acidobacteriota bacterium]